MLVLSRKLGERIVIGDNIVVQVVLINRGTVRLGIVAPDAVPILREELLNPPAPESPSDSTIGRRAESR